MAIESKERVQVAREEDRRFRRGHNAIGAHVRRKGTQAVLRVEIDGPLRGYDERPDVKRRSDPNWSADNESHFVRGRQLDQGGKQSIPLGEGQVVGEI